ncbi:YdbL family protein [uncultured Novosphingobium sp.]|uniref:YdbL family protein n=1 Tax=uncultured Novosphingobium sp. TaxID=292277 RepID=UPI00258E39C0|nr:YdbL family protein [uncultured Novosphingobium sp.]
MKSISHLRSLALAGLGGAMLLGLSAPAFADRDPAYAAARSAGQVGEKTDGYLGVVSGGGGDLRGLVDKINIQRRANYTQRAASQNATVEEYAFTQGCLLIARTAPGEKYQSPDGSWQTRGSGAPQRDPRCP